MCLGIPGQILEISNPEQMRAGVDVEGVRREVSVAMLGLDPPDGAQVGDWVVVHVGFALAKIDEAEARAMLDERRALGVLYEQALSDHFGAIEGLEQGRSSVW